jgi:hypothetical protein
MAVYVFVVVGFEDGVVDAVVGSHLEEYVDGVGDYEEDRGDAGDLENAALEIFGRHCGFREGNRAVEYSWDNEPEAAGEQVSYIPLQMETELTLSVINCYRLLQ